MIPRLPFPTGRRCRPMGARGVTYVELMMVTAVMAVLATFALPTAKALERSAKEKQLRLGLAKIRTAIDRYHHDWELGYIESPNEFGWPESLEELNEGVDYLGPPDQTAATTPLPGALPQGRRTGGNQAQEEPELKRHVYLPRIPADPFNRHGDDWDVSGWKARSYEDETDSEHWAGDGVYDVRSSSDDLALNGHTRYEEW